MVDFYCPLFLLAYWPYLYTVFALVRLFKLFIYFLNLTIKISSVALRITFSRGFWKSLSRRLCLYLGIK